MGLLKFTFPNSQDIYLHDTPAKNKFAEADRADSNGCVRVEDAQRFARWLLGREPVAPGADPEIPVQMPAGVPVGTLAIGVSGAKNAGLLAASIIGLNDEKVRGKVETFRREQTEAVLAQRLE